MTPAPISFVGWLTFLTLAGWLPPSSLAVPSDSNLIVEVSTERDLVHSPMVVEVGQAASTGEYLLIPESGGLPIPATIFEGEPPGQRILRGLLPTLTTQDGKPRTERYRLKPLGDRDAATPAFAFRAGRTPGSLELHQGDELITTYFDGTADAYKPYFHPLNAPGGTPVTRGYPMSPRPGEPTDHNHHRAFWFTYGEVNDFDFWAADPLNEKGKPNPRYGRIRPWNTPEATSSTSTPSTPTARAGVGAASLTTVLRWTNASGERALLEERRTTWFYGDTQTRILDSDITLTALKEPVHFGDTKEGMFGLRVASTMDVDASKRKEGDPARSAGGRIVNAEGLTNAEAWGKRSAWVDYSGPAEGRIWGVAILDHPTNLNHPTAWHVRTYGLFAANPIGRRDFNLGDHEQGPFTLAPGEALRLRYRVIIHPGDEQQGRIAQAFASYANPPQVKTIRP